MSEIMQDLIGQYVEAIKKYTVHMYDRLFFMVLMREGITVKIQMWIL